MSIARLDEKFFDFGRRPVRNPLRSTGLVEEADASELAVPAPEFVPGLATDSELATEVAHPLTVLEAYDKAHSFAHDTGFFPGHRRTSSSVPMNSVSPMCPV